MPPASPGASIQAIIAKYQLIYFILHNVVIDFDFEVVLIQGWRALITS
jgi:hypothetical protein